MNVVPIIINYDRAIIIIIIIISNPFLLTLS